MRSPLTLHMCGRKRSAKQPYRVSIHNPSECRTGTSPTAHSDLRKRMSYQGTTHHRPRTSPITIPNKDLHRTIKYPVVIANRKRSRHTKRPNNCIRFVRAAKTKASGLTGGYSCLIVIAPLPWTIHFHRASGSSGRLRFRVMKSTQRCGVQTTVKILSSTFSS